MLNYQRVNIGFVWKYGTPKSVSFVSCFFVRNRDRFQTQAMICRFRFDTRSSMGSIPSLPWHPVPSRGIPWHQDGTTACLFVVASNLNSLIGLLSRLMAMERWRSSGLFHVGGPWGALGILQIHADALKSTKKPRESMVNHHFPDSLTAIV